MKQRLSLWMMSLLFGVLPMTAANVTSDPSVLEFGKMWMEGGCIAKLTQRLCIEVKNIGDKDYYGVWIVGDENEKAEVTINGTHYNGSRNIADIQIAAAETPTIVTINFYASKAGKYKIYCACPDANDQPMVLFTYEIDIADYQEPLLSCDLKLNMLEHTDEGDILYCDTSLPRISGTVCFTNQGDYELLPLGVNIRTSVNFESVEYPERGAIHLTNQIIKPGETINQDFEIDLGEKPEEGKKYYVEVRIGKYELVVARMTFTVKQCTNTYWTADSKVKPLPLVDGILRIPAEALAVDLRGQHHTNTIYSVDVSEANPNCLYYLEFLDNVPQGFISEANIIRGGEAKTLVVNADYDYFCPMPFKAREALFNYTPYSESKGPAEPYWSWTYSGFIFFPFDIQKAWSNTVNDLQESTEFNGNYFKTSRLVHASTLLEFSSILNEDKLSAFTPYLITNIIPASASFTYYAEDVTIPSTNAQMVGKCDNFSYIGSTVETVAPKGAYMWSNDKFGFFLCEEGTKVRPFTPVIVQREPIEFEGETFIVGDHLEHLFYQPGLIDEGNESTDLKDIKTLRNKKAQANEGRLSVYSLSGQRVTTVEATDGRLEGLKPGMYIIGGKKVVVR